MPPTCPPPRPRPDPTIIRPFRPGDEAALLALVRELQAHEHALFDRMKPPSDMGLWYIDDLKRQCADHAGEILVLECQAKLLGYATVLTGMASKDSDELSYRYALIGDLAVAQAVRGEGLGRQLLDACEARAKVAGAHWLRVGVLAPNDRARRIYEACGFREHWLSLEKPLA